MTATSKKTPPRHKETAPLGKKDAAQDIVRQDGILTPRALPDAQGAGGHQMAHDIRDIPKNTLFVCGWADLPARSKQTTYIKRNDGEQPSFLTVSDRTRQVSEALMSGPVCAASPCRISEYVNRLRAIGFKIETIRFSKLPKGGCGNVGVYFPRDAIRAENVEDLQDA